MAKAVDIENKLIEKYKRKVHSQFPKAFLVTTHGRYSIVQEQEDFTWKDVLAELLILPQDSPLKAWEMAQVTAKTTQNFNRTHPDRLSAMKDADKLERIMARKLKAEQDADDKPKKRTKIDSYYIYD